MYSSGDLKGGCIFVLLWKTILRKVERRLNARGSRWRCPEESYHGNTRVAPQGQQEEGLRKQRKKGSKRETEF